MADLISLLASVEHNSSFLLLVCRDQNKTQMLLYNFFYFEILNIIQYWQKKTFKCLQNVLLATQTL